MKICAKVHGKETMKQIRKDYPTKSNKKSVEKLLSLALKECFLEIRYENSIFL